MKGENISFPFGSSLSAGLQYRIEDTARSYLLFYCKKLHESPLQLCVYVAKLLVEVIGDLDEIFACY